MNKEEVLQKLQAGGVILVVRAEDPASVLPGMRAVLKGGITTMEVTFTVPNAPVVLQQVAAEIGEEILLGAGTVTTTAQVDQALASGAKFIVAPNTNPKVIERAKSRGVPVFPGAYTPTEVQYAWELGADVVKIFPASHGGPAYIKALRGPFPHIPMCPTGGVDVKTVGAFFQAGAFCVGAGGALFSPEKLQAGDWEGMTATAREFVGAMNAARR